MPASDALVLGDETAEIARVVVEGGAGGGEDPRGGGAVYAYVKAAILDRAYPGGELLTEGELATAVRLSPVRRFARHCFAWEASGLVKLYPKRGALVLPVLPQEIDDVLEARELIETHAAAKVWPRRKQLIETLTQRVDEMRARIARQVTRRPSWEAEPRLPRGDRRCRRQPNPGQALQQPSRPAGSGWGVPGIQVQAGSGWTSRSPRTRR